MSPDLSKAVQELADHLVGRSEERRQKVLAMASMLSGTPSSPQPDASTGSQSNGSAQAASTNSAPFSTGDLLVDHLVDRHPGLSREMIDRYLEEI